MVTLEMKHAKR